MISWSILPNLLSLVRIFLVVPCVFWLWQRDYAATLVVFITAAVTDGLDGGLAKRFGWGTRLGSLLDPIADKILLGGVILTLGWQGLLPPWWVVGVIGRDVIILAGALAYRTWIGYLEGTPTGVSKLNTVLQLLSVLLVVAESYRPSWVVPRWHLILLSVTFVTTLVSGLDYVVCTTKRAQAERPLRIKVP
jgi:cardiolipin synthase (CMP-forming)